MQTMRISSIHALTVIGTLGEMKEKFAPTLQSLATCIHLHACEVKNRVSTPTLTSQTISIIFSAVFITAMFCKYLVSLLAREHLNSFTTSCVEYSGHPQDKYIYKHSTYVPILAQLDKNNLNGVFTNACCFKICLNYEHSRYQHFVIGLF